MKPAKKNTDLALPAGDAAPFSIAEVLGLPANASAEELLEIAVGEYNAAGLRMARAGAALNALRDVSKQFGNDFLPLVESRGIAKSHAYNAMQLADYLGSLPEADARRMLKVPYTKVLAIANADPEVVAELLEEGALDGDQPLSVRALRQRLGERDRQLEAMRVDVETAQMEKEALEQQLASRTHKGAPPTCILALRQEAAATHASIAGSLDLFAQVLEDVPGSFATATLQRQADAALASAFLLLKGEQARITTVMAELVRRAPDLEESFQAEQLLSADERSTALINARTIFTALQDEATTRAVAREAGATRGRGRPPKTEPKAIRKGKKG